jgi:hypothetical protein
MLHLQKFSHCETHRSVVIYHEDAGRGRSMGHQRHISQMQFRGDPFRDDSQVSHPGQDFVQTSGFQAG